MRTRSCSASATTWRRDCWKISGLIGPQISTASAIFMIAPGVIFWLNHRPRCAVVNGNELFPYSFDTRFPPFSRQRQRCHELQSTISTKKRQVLFGVVAECLYACNGNVFLRLSK